MYLSRFSSAAASSTLTSLELPSLSGLDLFNRTTQAGQSLEKGVKQWMKHLPDTLYFMSWYLGRDRARAPRQNGTQILHAHQDLLRLQSSAHSILNDIAAVDGSGDAAARTRAVANQLKLTRDLPQTVDQMVRALKELKQRLQTAFNHAQDSGSEKQGLRTVMAHGQLGSWEDAFANVASNNFRIGDALNREQVQRAAEYIQEVNCTDS